MSNRTPDQERAAHAWQIVSDLKELKGKDKKEQDKIDKLKKQFDTQVHKMPPRILASGLGPSLAFLEAKEESASFGGKALPNLNEVLTQWIERKRHDSVQPPRRLIQRIIESDADFLRFASNECLAYLQWLVRFVDAQELVPENKQG
jgi:CRISPR type III-B/RAMP module-associated protein Cmr5